MAISGNFQYATSYQSGAMKWGTGWNPIHAVENAYGGRSDKPIHTFVGPQGPLTETLDPGIVDPNDPEEAYPDAPEYASYIWGYGTETGTADRPGLGEPTEDFRGSVTDYWPGYGPYPGGMPGGTFIRAQGHGAQWMDTAKLGDKEETVSEGWVNKEVGNVDDAQVSDPSQYEMQTSMTQRDKVREGSQISGTASEHDAPIGSWRPTWNQRIKPWSGARRHWDMLPKEQNERIRPFWYRRAGVGYVEYMQANEADQYMRNAMQRQPVPDPYAGVPVPQSGNVFQEESYPVQDYVNVWY